MKFCIIFFGFIISMASHAYVGDENPQYAKIRDCFKILLTPSDLATHLKRAQTCYDEAKPFDTSDSLSGRALYMEALSYYQAPEDNFIGFQKLSFQFLKYYSKFLAPFLVPSGIPQLSDAELKDALASTMSATSYSYLVSAEEPGLNQSELIFNELLRRRSIGKIEVSSLFQMFLRNSEWQQAKNMSVIWPSLGFIPAVVLDSDVKNNELAYYTLSNDLQDLILERAEIALGPRIVMFGDCHFAIDAINALTSKSEFPAIMKKIGIVLADAGNNDFANINILRKAHPEFELHPVHKQGLWGQKGFNIFDSPNLVFLSDGVAKFSFVGSGPEVIKNFCSGLKSIGIAAPESCPN